MRLAVALAVLAAVLALLAVLLGSRSPDRARLTYPAFQRAASAACLRYHRGLSRLGAPTSLGRIGTVARGAQRLGAAERGALGRLAPPPEAAPAFARLLAGLGRADALLPALRRAAEAGDAARARVLVRRGRALVARANLDAVAVGLSDCRRS
jgi:hypothetical protein